MKKDFLSIADLTKNELEELFEITKELKQKPYGTVLRHKTLVMLFEKASTRTRLSFEAGIGHFEGRPIYIDASTSQLSRGETVPDTARVMERFVQGIIARVYKHEMLVELAKNSHIPVINALSDLEHPCQTLADLYTVLEKAGTFKGQKIAYVGDGDNVCNSLMLGCALLGIEFSAATPWKYKPNARIYAKSKKLAGDKIRWYEDPFKAVMDASFVYTDVFVSMGDEAQAAERLKTFIPKYTVTAELMAHARKGAKFMHCLPAHRGQEVAAEVIDGPNSIVFDQAENRLHAQKALLKMLYTR
ncbi:MAG TPA: ornithine carbamoyltransferase [Conexivisphaerales archaeon]|nr:ornithine carbamoyltransferase [Conexivisphaerales archaeon]